MGTFYNNANCDIYIGQGAGKKLLDDISKTKSSIKIVSPYLSPFLIKELIHLYNKGINVHLITSDNIEDFYKSEDKIIHNLIIQHKKPDLEAEKIRNKWIDIYRLLLYAIIGLSLILLLSIYFYRELKLIYGIVPLVMLFLIRKFYEKKITTKRIYTYSYSQLFPFKVYVSPDNASTFRNTFIHGKIYIIDKEIVYMGSLNFTGRGTKDNYETRIRTTDIKAVQKIVEEFDDLFYHSGLPQRDIQQWGSEIYYEPIN